MVLYGLTIHLDYTTVITAHVILHAVGNATVYFLRAEKDATVQR